MLPQLGETTRRAIAERWAVRDFRPQEIIVSQGSRSMGLWFVLDGFVRVERQHGERPVVLTFLQEGDVFGEISWLEQEGASAAVVAESGGTQVALLRDTALEDLAAAVPAASVEIHRALATLLARRLRVTSARVRRSQSFDEAAQARQGGSDQHAASPSPGPGTPPRQASGGAGEWIGEARALAGRFREVRGLSRREPARAADALVALMEEAVTFLARAASASSPPGEAPGPLQEASDALYPELLPFLILSPALSRLQMVPSDQRHPSVYEQMLALADPASADPTGAALDRWAARLPSCRAIRARRDGLAAWLGQRLAPGDGRPGAEMEPRRIALVGSGAAEALGLLLESDSAALSGWQVAVIGPEEVPFARLESLLAGDRTSAPPLFIEADPFSGDLDARLLPQDLVVSCGPADFCDDATAARALAWMAGQLAGDGRELVLATLSPSLGDLAFVQTILGWPIHGMRPADVERLATSAPHPLRIGPPPAEASEEVGFHLIALRPAGVTARDQDGAGA